MPSAIASSVRRRSSSLIAAVVGAARARRRCRRRAHPAPRERGGDHVVARDVLAALPVRRVDRLDRRPATGSGAGRAASRSARTVRIGCAGGHPERHAEQSRPSGACRGGCGAAFGGRQRRHRAVTGADPAEHAAEQHRPPVDRRRPSAWRPPRREVRIRAREVEPELEHAGGASHAPTVRPVREAIVDARVQRRTWAFRRRGQRR